MQPSDPNNEYDPSASPSSPNRPRFRLLSILFLLLLLVLLLTLVPPLLNVSRLQRRVASNIGASLGRPVHFDRVALTLLPLPGFSLERFVIEEDPAFGSEPILRANEVRATIRISSLWSHHVEFSKISLTDPSVNLVRKADGEWNLQSILLQASRIQVAPTAQPYAGPAPRFPYIEAAGARIDLKLDQEKTPFSLTDADFGLWLPEPDQWHFRIEAHPTRTDAAPTDTGVVRIEGTLGGAQAHPDAYAKTLAQVPVDIHGSWQDAQLGGLSRLLLSRDAGLRGELTLAFSVLGTISHAAIATNLDLAHVRRSDFVPPRLLSLQATCQALAENGFSTFSAIECHWPPADSPDPSTLIATGAVPDTRHPETSYAELTLPALPAATFLDWIRVASRYPPTGLLGTGNIAGALAWRSDHHASWPVWSGELEFSGASLSSPALGPQPVALSDILLRSRATEADTSRPLKLRGAAGVHMAAVTKATPDGDANGFDLLPVQLPLGGRQPATLTGHFDTTGYTLHLTGAAIPTRLLTLGDAIPQFGDGLRQLLEPVPAAASVEALTPGEAHRMESENSKSAGVPRIPQDPHNAASRAIDVEPINVDLTATRTWGGRQIWRETTPSLARPPSPTRR
jgi:AsmA family